MQEGVHRRKTADAAAVAVFGDLGKEISMIDVFQRLNQTAVFLFYPVQKLLRQWPLVTKLLPHMCKVHSSNDTYLPPTVGDRGLQSLEKIFNACIFHWWCLTEHHVMK